MSKPGNDSPLEGVYLRDALPIAWEPLTDLPSDGEQLREQRQNVELLQYLLLRDETPLEGAEGEHAQEQFQRLESRLDLLMNLVSEMLMLHSGPLPATATVTLNAKGLHVHQQAGAKRTPKHQTLLRIRLHLEPQFPRPLLLYARVEAVEGQDFSVEFLPQEARLQALLDKYLFRQHRRAIALARQGENAKLTTS